MSWATLEVEAGRGSAGEDDPDNVLGPVAAAAEGPFLEWDPGAEEPEPVGEPVDWGEPDDDVPQAAGVVPSRRTVVAESYAEELHPRGRGGKWIAKGLARNSERLAGEDIDSLQLHKRSDGTLDPHREELHRQIIQHFMRTSTPQSHPEALFTAGGGASGKSSLVKALPVPSNHVYVNPDDIKAMLPEYQRLRDTGHEDIAAAKVHEESSQIAARLAATAMHTRRTVVIDGVGNSRGRKFLRKLEGAKAQGYRVTVRYAHVPFEEAARREEARRAKEGRAVPHDVLAEQHQKAARQYYDHISRMQGTKIEVYSTAGPEGEAPRLIAEHVPPHGALTVHDQRAYSEFVAKRHLHTSVAESVYMETLHPRDRLGRWRAEDELRAANSLEHGEPTTVAISHVRATLAAIDAKRVAPVNLSNLHVSGADHGNLFDYSATEIPRERMPQLGKAADVQAFAEHVRRHGVKADVEEVSPLELHATQNQMNAQSVHGILRRIERRDPVMEQRVLPVSGEGAVIDGHHGWAAATVHALEHPEYRVHVLRVHASTQRTLELARSFADARGIPNRAIQAAEETPRVLWTDDEDEIPAKLEMHPKRLVNTKHNSEPQGRVQEAWAPERHPRDREGKFLEVLQRAMAEGAPPRYGFPEEPMKVLVDGEQVGPHYTYYSDAKWVAEKVAEAFPHARVAIHQKGRYMPVEPAKPPEPVKPDPFGMPQDVPYKGKQAEEYRRGWAASVALEPPGKGAHAAGWRAQRKAARGRAEPAPSGAEVQAIGKAMDEHVEPRTEKLPVHEWMDPPPPVGSNRHGAGGYSSDAAYGTNTALGRVAEEAFTRIVGGRILHPEGKGEQSPLDVRFDGYGFEVKGVSTKSVGYKATPKSFERAQKEAMAKELGVKGALAIVVVDSEQATAHAYFREGLKGGRLSQKQGWRYLGSTALGA